MKQLLILFLLTLGSLSAGSTPIEREIALEAESLSLTPLWKSLLKDGYFEALGQDRDIRTPFVTLQGIVEKTLAKELGKTIVSLEGIIHTPMPATPLCVERNKTPRASIIRGYLEEGANLYIVYPKQGFFGRSQEERATYQKALTEYKGHLFDTPLDVESIPLELIGATYVFQDLEGKQFLFSIKMTQANNPQENANYALWLGPLDHPKIQKRIEELNGLLHLSFPHADPLFSKSLR